MIFTKNKINELSTDTSVSTSDENYNEKCLFKLLANYLLSKTFIPSNTSELIAINFKKSINDDNEVEEGEKSKNKDEHNQIFILHSICKLKNIQQFMRQFQTNKAVFSNEFKLNLIKYIKNKLQKSSNDEELINFLLLTPFIIQNELYDTDDKYDIINLIELYLTKTLSNLNIKNESECFYLSVLTWQYLLCTNRTKLDQINVYTNNVIDLLLDKMNSNNKCVVHLLRTLDYLMYFKYNIYSNAFNNSNDKSSSAKLIEFLKQNLSSPFHDNRLSCLNLLIKLVNNNNIDIDNIFTVCFKSELIAANIETYREKLYHLQRLDYDICHKLVPSDEYQDVSI